MFGKRPTGGGPAQGLRGPAPAARAEPAAPPRQAPAAVAVMERPEPAAKPLPQSLQPSTLDQPRSDDYYQTKSMVFGALIEAIDVSQLAKLDTESAREEIRDIVSEIIRLKNVMMSIAEQ